MIDTLNSKKQMDYQLETWGKDSERIDDYERRGLIQHLMQDPIFRLWRWVDPWFYRNQIAVPKLIINGTNDRYWTVDELNNYWDDIQGPKFIRYVPNAGHNLQAAPGLEVAPGNRDAAFATLGTFFHHVVDGHQMPMLDWKHETEGELLKLKIQSLSKPTSVKLWTATSATKDFRQSQWYSKPIETNSGVYVGEVAKPKEGHVAL